MQASSATSGSTATWGSYLSSVMSYIPTPAKVIRVILNHPKELLFFAVLAQARFLASATVPSLTGRDISTLPGIPGCNGAPGIVPPPGGLNCTNITASFPPPEAPCGLTPEELDLIEDPVYSTTEDGDPMVSVRSSGSSVQLTSEQLAKI